MIAVISLMGYRLLAHASPVEDDGARSRERFAGYPVMMPAQEQLRGVIPAGCGRHDDDHGRFGRAAAGAVGHPERLPVHGRPGICLVSHGRGLRGDVL
jgi:hypothetical protein